MSLWLKASASDRPLDRSHNTSVREPTLTSDQNQTRVVVVKPAMVDMVVVVDVAGVRQVVGLALVIPDGVPSLPG